ncbi:hypothetical protein [Empedobacter sedimenti]|uniref:hypothetical protein n=1 Tax=Empedobacter sedimenti TaxID=3042610 RepID=UPI0024A75E33|nr:hypothetical protein [Empedobacter sedimenti]
MKNYLIILLTLLSSLSFAQDKIQRILPKQLIYIDLLDDLGNPLAGDPVLVVNYFAEKEGSYLFYFNEAKAKGESYLTDNPKDLHGGLYIEDHGGILELIKFKDFAGPLSEPSYLLDFCVADDADKNKSPEFYLTYFEASDGLDAKPLKIIVYSKNGKTFTKSKITAWIPFQPEDKYKVEKDENYKKLPKSIQVKAEQLLNKAKSTL